jgi:hypothetical protein
VHRVALGQQLADDGVAGLVVGRVAALFLGHDHGLALGAHDDLVLGLLEVLHLHHARIAAGGHQGGFVAQVGQVGAGHAGRAAGDDAGLTSWPIGILRMWTFRICSRPRMSGSVT